jgi:hypothetical protein
MTRLAIGIPTRNRAELATMAVESVLSSTRAVPVVVSDNSTEGEHQKRLESFCARQSEQVRYVRPAEPLSMAAHWEWLRHVIEEDGPTHIAFLTDRLLFAAAALIELLGIVEREPESVVSYHHDRLEDAEPPVELVQTQWTGKLLELDARKLIELSSRGVWGDYLPRMLNSVVPVSTLAAIERRFGGVFAPVSPDYRFAYRCLAIRESILYLDRACLIEHGLGSSSGISFAVGRPNRHAVRFQDELPIPRFGKTPEPRFETTANAIFEEYCAVREEVVGGRFPAVHDRGYLAANATSISRIESPEWRARMTDLLRQKGWRRRDSARRVLGQALAVAVYFARHPGAFARSVWRQLWERPPGTPAAFLLPRVGLKPGIRDDLRFESSRDAIAHANAHPRARTLYAWHVHTLRRAGAIRREARAR